MSGAGKSIFEHYVKPEAEKPVFEEHDDARPASRFRLSATGWIGVSVVLFWAVVAIIGPWIAPWGENDLPFPDDYGRFQPPRPGAWLGTDAEDRDVLSRIIYGASRTFGISLAAATLAYVIGTVLGVIATVTSPRVDMILSRIVDAFLSLPNIMLGLVVVAALGSSIPVLIVTAGVIYSCIVFRLARTLSADVMVCDFVEAARVRGETMWWIIFCEIWPNISMPLISDFGLRLIYVILFTAGLSFLGLGIQPPQADWGSMVRENLAAFQTSSASIWAPLAPAISIASLTVGINLIVDDIAVYAGGRFAKSL